MSSLPPTNLNRTIDASVWLLGQLQFIFSGSLTIIQPTFFFTENVHANYWEETEHWTCKYPRWPIHTRGQGMWTRAHILPLYTSYSSLPTLTCTHVHPRNPQNNPWIFFCLRYFIIWRSVYFRYRSFMTSFKLIKQPKLIRLKSMSLNA